MREEEIQNRVEKMSEKMMNQLTNENKSNEQLKKQFFFMAQNHDSFPFMSDMDLALYKQSMSSIQLQSFGIFSLVLTSSVVAYKLFGGFTASATSPWLRRGRHAAAIGLPTLILPGLIQLQFPGQSGQEIQNLALKYKETLLNPNFNRKFVNDQAQKFRAQVTKN